jgi:signal recognition particle subunit SRP54
MGGGMGAQPGAAAPGGFGGLDQLPPGFDPSKIKFPNK